MAGLLYHFIHHCVEIVPRAGQSLQNAGSEVIP